MTIKFCLQLAALKHHLTGNLVEAHSIAAPGHRPWLLAVGGSDPLLRVFDRRVGYSAGPIKVRPRPWVSKCTKLWCGWEEMCPGMSPHWLHHVVSSSVRYHTALQTLQTCGPAWLRHERMRLQAAA